MSLIPYNSNDSRSVVLRHQRTLVVFDPRSCRFSLREAPPATALTEPILQTCPFCKCALHHGEEPDDGANSPSVRNVPLAESGFVDQDYFRMLESSVSIGQVDGVTSRRIVGRQLPRLKPEDTLETVDDSEDGMLDDPELPHRRNSDGHGIDATAFSPGYFKRFFVEERVIGKGGKGVVLLVKHVLDGVPLGNFACKRVPVGDNHEWLKKVLFEVQLLQGLSHQNLVSYRHVWLEDCQLTTFGPSVPCAFILQQYCNSGDLHNYILVTPSTKNSTNQQLKDMVRRRTRGQPDLPENTCTPRKVPFDQIISFFSDITSGLSHLHSQNFIHRDLKPSNCLLHDTGDGLRVLVSDFGESQHENQMRKSTGTTGTISYCAPEVLRRVSPNGNYGNFTQKSDVFSLGMILHFICFGRLPYNGADALNEENEDVASLREEITAWRGLDEATKLRTDLPERLYHSLKTLINPDPALRPSASDILLGIEMGIGEEAPTVRTISSKPKAVTKKQQRRGGSPRGSPTVIDDSQALGFRRISPVADTPRPGTPVNGVNGLSSLKEYSTPQSERAATEPLPSIKKPRRRSLLSGQPIVPLPSLVTNSTESSVILRRPRAISPAPPTSVTAIPPSRQLTWHAHIRRSPQWILAFKVTFFFFKIFTLTRPCFPAAVQAWFFYSMIGLAMVDFAAIPPVWTIALGGAHFLFLTVMQRLGNMCMY